MSGFDAVVIVVGSLDSLPNAGRLFLSAVLLALLLGFINRRIAPANIALGVSFRKSALLALLLIPALIHFVIGARLVLVVEELPAVGSAPGYLWWLLLGIWIAGVGYQLKLGERSLKQRLLVVSERDIAGIEDVDPKLDARFAHWRRRLNMPAEVRLALGNVQVPLCAGFVDPVIVLPKAAAHWPVTVQDLLLTRELCRLKLPLRIWAAVGECVAALYWPVAWVKAIGRGLSESLEQTGNRLAMSCFNDRLGYERASKQLEQRLEAETERSPMPEWESVDVSLGARVRYRERSRRKDPQYDRVFWSLVQATVVVFVLTGTTLRQLEEFDPEEVDLAERWYFSYERSADYSDKQVETTTNRGRD